MTNKYYEDECIDCYNLIDYEFTPKEELTLTIESYYGTNLIIKGRNMEGVYMIYGGAEFRTYNDKSYLMCDKCGCLNYIRGEWY